MMFNELARGAISDAQLLDEREAANEPRQAYVTRSEGNGVWVRFGTDGPTAPESWFTSTVVGVPPGTMGWVYPLAGGKGLFVVAAVRIPSKPKSGNSWSGQTVSTAGDYVWTSQTALLTFSDLTPGASYELSWTVQLNWWTAAAATGQIGARVTDASGHRFLFTQGRLMRPSGATGSPHDESSWSYSETVTARPDGTVQVCPAFRWASGTTYFQNAYILARID